MDGKVRFPLRITPNDEMFLMCTHVLMTHYRGVTDVSLSSRGRNSGSSKAVGRDGIICAVPRTPSPGEGADAAAEIGGHREGGDDWEA